MFQPVLESLKARFPHGMFAFAEEDQTFRRAASAHFRQNGRGKEYGAYVVRAGSSGRVLYVGRSGVVTNSGTFKDQGLLGRLTNSQGRVSRNAWFAQLRDEYGPLIVEYVVLDKTFIPGLAEATLMQAHLDEFGRLPPKNQGF